LIGLEPSRVSQSPSLRQEVDTVHEIAKADVFKFLKLLTPAPPKPAVALGPAAVIPIGPAVVAAAVAKASASVGPAKTIHELIDEAIQKWKMVREKAGHWDVTATMGRFYQPKQRSQRV